MQKIINILTTTAGLSHEKATFSEIQNLDPLFAEGYKIVQIISHGFVAGTLGVMMTIVLEKPDKMPPAKPRRVTSF